MKILFLRGIVGFFAMAFANVLGFAGTIWLDADPSGTGKNVNILGAVYNSSTDQVTDWGSYRDYRFQLAATPQATLGDFGLRLSVNKSSAFSSPLNITWFADSITPYAATADYQTALGTVGASNLPTGAFAFYVVGPGSFKSPVTIPTTKTAYWVRIWSATSGGNDKYQTKLADMVDLEYVASVGGITMYNYNESTSSYSATAATQTTNINPVPEPAGMVGFVGAAVCGATVVVRRCRRRAAA